MLVETTMVLAGLSACLMIWQWAVAARFPLHRRKAAGARLPAVSVLKPLRGCDAETKGCLASWFRQDYPDFEILFGVADLDDPVCEIVRELQADHPNIQAKLVVCDLAAGPNRKVAKLAFLEPLARRQILVVSDADVKAPVDYLRQTIPELMEDETGLVNSFYFLSTAVNLAMRWESLAVNADFWSSVLQAKSLKPVDFALGAVMAIRRPYLDRIGGFARLASFLADDYQLGSQIARVGGRIKLGAIAVECRDAPHGFNQVWHHQLRWSRTIRVCQPVPFFFSVLANPTLWALAWFACGPSRATAVATGLVLLLRMVMAGHLQGRMSRASGHWPYVWLAPVKDLLQFVLWTCSFTRGKVLWRGEVFKVNKSGRLVHGPTSPSLQEVGAG